MDDILEYKDTLHVIQHKFKEHYVTSDWYKNEFDVSTHISALSEI